MISVVQELNRHSRLEETIQGNPSNQHQKSTDFFLDRLTVHFRKYNARNRQFKSIPPQDSSGNDKISNS